MTADPRTPNNVPPRGNELRQTESDTLESANRMSLPAGATYSDPHSALRAPRSKIRLVHCIGSLRLGGAEKQLAELICRLPRERFEQSLVLLQGGGPLVERVRAAGCPVLELNYSQKFKKFDPRCYAAMGHALGRYIRHLRERRPHILHAQLYWANVLSVVAGRLARVPVIVTSRLQLSNYKFGRPMLQKIENVANRWTTAVFVNSEAVRRDVLAHEKIAPAKLKVIYNGVVLENFGRPDPEPLRREFEIQPGQIVLTAVANLHPYKGHDDLLRATASLIGKYPNLRVILPGRDQGMRSRLEELIKELKLEAAVRLIGERKDVPQILALADIVIHPSHEEGFSNSILEAMAAGKPLVVTDVGGNPEAVLDGRNGYVVPARSPQALAAALDSLIGNAELRERMGRASRQRIEEDFAIERMMERFIAWYESLAVKARP